MNIISLPPKLPGDLDLEDINQQLKAGTTQLDWSAVESAPTEALSTLLAGLDISDDADILGLDGDMADTTMEAILAWSQTPATTQSSEKKSKDISPQDQQPAIWEQASFLDSNWSDGGTPDTTGQVPLFEQQINLANSIPDTVPDQTTLERDSPKQPPTEAQETPEIKEQKIADIPPARILRKLSPYQIRNELEKRVLKDLLGPAQGEYEEIDERRVTDRYLVGLLAPQKRSSGERDDTPELQDDLGSADTDSAEDGKSEPASAIRSTIFPSSFGMTFCVSGEATAIHIVTGWGQYERGLSETYQTQAGNPKNVWKRYPIRSQSPAINLTPGPIDEWRVDPDVAVYVRGKIRRHGSDWIVSLFLVNAQTEPQQQADQAWLFQPELKVKSVNPDQKAIFLKRPLKRRVDHKLDPAYHAEEQAMAMLYRKQVEFAVGHGVAIHATVDKTDRTLAVELATTVIPKYEVPKATPPTAQEIPELSGLVLDMKALASTLPEELPDKLAALPTAYAQWIQEQQASITQPESGLIEYQDAAERALQNCDRALERIRTGIDMLKNDPQAARAFIFMNRAMYQQRVRSIYARDKRQGKDVNLDEIDSPTWFPFQLAFVLLNLASTTDLHHSDRCDPTQAVADLLWFPTGGGKTEAYLGLAAYTIGLRRLQGTVAGRSGAAGVAVLMRYTLRLLTLQQFQRATALICACEVIRREDPDTWGQEPFRIGLWVGMNTTPNRTGDSAAQVEAIRRKALTSGGSPHQLTSCPWCGSTLDPGRHIKVSTFKKGHGRTLVYCGDQLGHCPFSHRQSKTEGLPIVVVDEEIYRRLPTLLIATVDKFAQMPWKGETQMLFGQVNGYCDRHGYRSPELDDADSHPARHGLPKAKTTPVNPLRPPDLIIQDELHLISGPLGTLVGLYETAIDKLASWDVDGKTVRPKVVASTATIRQAQDQVHNLFLRKVEIFPPQGLNAEDNFFSRQRTPGPDSPGRRYLGICASGRRLKAATIRVYTAILSASQDLFNDIGDSVDPWMTLVGYFNSMRELGGTRRLVDDDIQQRLNKMDRRGLARRPRLIVEELTSRKSSTDIPNVLDHVETPFQNASQATTGSKPKRPLDVLLATNMISVGVDVPRLAVMAVTGQPKTTAEYIQSTSRVGRRYPGIVFTIFNWARPRDLSHYERFEHYHATFYQNVESLSVTPFSPGAIDRGLAALMVSLIRLMKEELNHNERAGRIQRDDPHVKATLDHIVERAFYISGEPEIRDLVRRELEARLDYWLDQAQDTEGGKTLGYKTQRDGTTLGLLENPGYDGLQPFTCLNSLRNVEPTIGLILNPTVPEDDSSRPPQPMPIQSAENS